MSEDKDLEKIEVSESQSYKVEVPILDSPEQGIQFVNSHGHNMELVESQSAETHSYYRCTVPGCNLSLSVG